MTFATREPVEISVHQLDHGLIMMALAHLAIDRADLYERAERVAAALNGHRMFQEMRDLKLRTDRERRKQNATHQASGNVTTTDARPSRDKARDEARA
jgi:hypothetical protein